MGNSIKPVDNVRISYDYTFINNQIDKTQAAVEAELKKGDQADFSKLLALVIRIGRFLNHKAGQIDREYVHEALEEIKLSTGKLQKTYNANDVLALTWISGSAQILGGGFGICGLRETENFQKLAKASQPLIGTGQGVGTLSQIPANKHERERTLENIALEEIKRQREDRNQAHSQNKGRESEADRIERDAEQSRHQALIETSRG